MIKLVVVVGFAIAFAAGLVIGIELHQSSFASTATAPTVPERRVGSTRPSGPNRSGVLTAGLNLTPHQQEQMIKFWEELAPQRGGGRGRDDSRRQLVEDRDQELLALYSPAEKVQYDLINQKYREKLTAMANAEGQAFEKAVNQTMEILNPEQQIKYREFLQQHRWDRGGPFGGPGGRGRGRGGGPGGRGPREPNSNSTRPSSDPAASGLLSPN